MGRESRPRGEQDRVLGTVARLVTAADGDTLYRDVYLRRAAELLSPTVTAAQYESALASREQLTRVLAQARAAVARQDWRQVRDLGTHAADLQRSLDAQQASLAAAETVYGAPTVVLDPLSPGLRSSKRWSGAAQARAETVAVLGELAREDPKARELYAARQRALEALALPGAATPGAPTGAAPGANVEQNALQALERGDAAALRRLADAMLGEEAGARPAGEEGAPQARGRIAVPSVLGEPLPEACLSRAAALGLLRVEVTLASPAVASAVTAFVERYAMGASPAAFDRAKDGVAHVTLAAEKLDVPPEVAALFAETISLFALHLYVNSAGVRYVPLSAHSEVLLVEAHAEGDEPVTPLLRELGLDRRRGLARDEIEGRLLKHGARIVAEHLGLDPLAFRIVCVPPDVFLRVGRDRGWGQRQEWTHFDGYQVTSGGGLRALVGGNARFGGLMDLCSISRDDARENTVVRLAVIRRERLGVRIE
jgi:hypothetical protein